MKSKAFSIVLVLLAIITFVLYASPVKEYFKNSNLDFEQEVYLGGDNIVIDYKTTIDSEAVTAGNEYVTIGTITYINKEGKFGAVAHKITDNKVESGNIYNSPVDSVIKSDKNVIGEKNVIINYRKKVGNISSLEETGIYGNYDVNYYNRLLLKVGMPSEIRKESALIYTVIDGSEVVAYNIEIVRVYYGRASHNIYFKLTDEALINKIGGVIQGMSGSPIVQDGKIIGAVSHVDNNNSLYGYGLFITYMV